MSDGRRQQALICQTGSASTRQPCDLTPHKIPPPHALRDLDVDTLDEADDRIESWGSMLEVRLEVALASVRGRLVHECAGIPADVFASAGTDAENTCIRRCDIRGCLRVADADAPFETSAQYLRRYSQVFSLKIRFYLLYLLCKTPFLIRKCADIRGTRRYLRTDIRIRGWKHPAGVLVRGCGCRAFIRQVPAARISASTGTYSRTSLVRGHSLDSRCHAWWWRTIAGKEKDVKERLRA